MTKIARSPNRGSFQHDAYLQRVDESGGEVNQEYVDMLKGYAQTMLEREERPEWREHNLEYDLRSTDWILEKVKDDRYAQNVYAALCNIRWQQLDVMPILKDQYWSCSWRYAGGIVADMQEKGDYIDWYCSGIGDGLGNGDSTGTKGYVPEGTVTDEIAEDFRKLGWTWSNWED